MRIAGADNSAAMVADGGSGNTLEEGVLLGDSDALRAQRAVNSGARERYPKTRIHTHSMNVTPANPAAR
jgi:hypothetical protein